MYNKLHLVWTRFPTEISKLTVLLISIAISFLLYGQTCFYSYAYDDILVCSENRYVQNGINGILHILTHDSFAGYYNDNQNLLVGARYRPFSLISFALENQIVGKWPGLSHFINVLLYGLCGFWVYRLINRFKIFTEDTENTITALLVTSLFLFHPIHTEVVANIKSRDELFAFLFCSMAMYFSLAAVDHNKTKFKIFTIIFLFFAFLSKENALCVLLLIPFNLYFFRNLSWPAILKQTWFALIPLVIFLWMRHHAVGNLFLNKADFDDIMNDPFIEMRHDQKWATIIFCLVWYLKLLILPYPLTHDYYPYHVEKMNFSHPLVFLSIILLLGLFFLMIKYFRKRYWLVFVILYFVCSLFLVSNILFSVGTFMNERFLFMPSFAFCMFLGLAFIKLRPNFKKWALAILILLLICSTTIIWSRNPAWKSTEDLYLRDLSTSKNSGRIHLYTGIHYLNKYQKAGGVQYLDKALSQINEAIRILPNYRQNYDMQFSILAEYHKINKNLMAFLQQTETCVLKYPDNNNVLLYFNYLNTDSLNAPLLFSYYSTMAYDGLYKSQKDYENALRYLGMAHQLNPSDIQTLVRIVEIYKTYLNSNGVPVEKQTLYRQQLELFQEQIIKLQPTTAK